jgi:hypothetical protein
MMCRLWQDNRRQQIPEWHLSRARDDDDISILIRVAQVSTGHSVKKYYLFRNATKTGGMAPPVLMEYHSQ